MAKRATITLRLVDRCRGLGGDWFAGYYRRGYRGGPYALPSSLRSPAIAASLDPQQMISTEP